MVAMFQNKKYITEMSKNKIPKHNDWRRQGQENYLLGLKLVFQDYHPYRFGWDHDHCEFCGLKFSLSGDDLRKGYSAANGYHWICSDCFNDFRDEFSWEVQE
jgi:hypothetical protein